MDTTTKEGYSAVYAKEAFIYWRYSELKMMKIRWAPSRGYIAHRRRKIVSFCGIRFTHIYVQYNPPPTDPPQKGNSQMVGSVQRRNFSHYVYVYLTWGPVTWGTHIIETEKSSGQASQFNIWTIGAMDRTSAQPQVNLTLLRKISAQGNPAPQFLYPVSFYSKNTLKFSRRAVKYKTHFFLETAFYEH